MFDSVCVDVTGFHVINTSIIIKSDSMAIDGSLYYFFNATY